MLSLLPIAVLGPLNFVAPSRMGNRSKLHYAISYRQRVEIALVRVESPQYRMAYRRRRTYRRRARRFRRNRTSSKKKFCTLPFARATTRIRPIIEPGSRWIKKRIAIRGTTGQTNIISFVEVFNGLTKISAGTIAQPYSTSSLFNIKISYVIVKSHAAGVNFAVYLNEDQVMQSTPSATERRYDVAANNSTSFAGLKINIPTAQQLALQIGSGTSAKWLQIDAPTSIGYDIVVGLKVQI